MKVKGIVSTAVAIICGLIVLGGYFIKLDILVNAKTILIQWAVILVAFAILVGILNLLIVHTNKAGKKQKGTIYSIILIISLVVTFLLGVISPYFKKIAPAFDFTFRAIQLPIEASLMALLAVTLTYGSIRLLRHRLNAFSVIFLTVTLISLLGMAPLPFIGDTPLISESLRPFIAQVLAGSGARGILIGVALGALTTGLRVLIGVDRPYEGK